MLFPTPTGYQFSLIENAAAVAVAVAFTDCNLEYLLTILATLVAVVVVVYKVSLVLVVVIDSSGESSATSLFTLSKCSSRSID